MAPIKSPKSNYSSSNYGEDIVRQANILASCYMTDSAAATLKGLHYCTTGLAGAECPPLAAITTTNQLALTPKARSTSSRTGRRGSPDGSESSAWHRRRGGAALRIREECERFFCETLRATFLGERKPASHDSGLASVYHDNHHHHHHQFQQHRNDSFASDSSTSSAAALYDSRPQPAQHHGQLTPPDDFPISDETVMAYGRRSGMTAAGFVVGWLEIWDYAGGSSFRGFVAEDTSRDAKTMFVFFDAHSVSRDLKQALVALIELAEGPLACSHMVICVERAIPEEESKGLTRGLQWAGFSLTTMDFWSKGFDVLSDRWIFMGMEL